MNKTNRKSKLFLLSLFSKYYCMKKHESRELEPYEEYKIIDNKTNKIKTKFKNKNTVKGYVDSNNFAHNLNASAWVYEEVVWGKFYIHGKYYEKEDWLKEREILLLEEHRENILNQL